MAKADQVATYQSASHCARPWLPRESLVPDRFEASLEAILTKWCTEWFPRLRPDGRIGLRVVANDAAPKSMWRTVDKSYGVGSAENGRLAVLEAMLDRSVTPSSVRDKDRAIVEDVVTRCVDDLVRRLSASSRNAGKEILSDEVADPAAVWEVPLKRPGTSITIAFSKSALVDWRKSLSPPSSARPISSILTGLQAQQVRIGCELGRGRLTLTEMEGLCVGDVVMLDRRTDSALPILVENQEARILAHLSPSVEEPSLTIAEFQRATKK